MSKSEKYLSKSVSLNRNQTLIIMLCHVFLRYYLHTDNIFSVKMVDFVSNENFLIVKSKTKPRRSSFTSNKVPVYRWFMACYVLRLTNNEIFKYHNLSHLFSEQLWLGAWHLIFATIKLIFYINNTGDVLEANKIFKCVS